MKKLVLTLFILLAALPARAETQVDLTYDIDYLGFTIGTIHYRIVQQGDAYTLTFDGGFGGIVGVIADADGTATTVGVMKDGKILPSRMDQVTHWGDKERNVYVLFDDAGNVKDYGAKPPYSPQGRVPVTSDMLKDVLDTQSSLLHVMPDDASQFCKQTVRVFDGRERYDLVFAPLSRKGNGLKCRVTPVRVAGHKVTDSAQKSFQMNFRQLTIEGHKLVIPEKTAKPFGVGTAVIRLTKVVTQP